MVHHGDQCICEICSCGRHHCPNPGMASSWTYGHQQNGTALESTEYKKEFAEKRSDRTEMIRPNQTSLVMGDQAPMRETVYNKEFRGHQLNGRLSPIKPRQQLSLAEGKFDDSSVSRETYRAYDNTERARQIRPKSNSDLRSNEPMNLTTSYHGDFVAKEAPDLRLNSSGKRNASQVRFGLDDILNANTSYGQDFQKADLSQLGNTRSSAAPRREYRPSSQPMDSRTVHREAFQDLKPAERAIARRPQSQYRLNTGDFAKATTNREDFKAHSTERARSQKPANEYRPPSQPFNSSTVSKETYRAYSGSGHRPDPSRPRNAYQPSSGRIDGVSNYRKDFEGKQSERQKSCRPYEQYRPSSQPMQAQTTNTETYKAGQGERCDTVRPKDQFSQLAAGDLATSTEHREQYKQVQGERYEMQKPRDNLTSNEGAFDSRTSNRDDFKGDAKGDRFEAVRPCGNIQLGDGGLETATHYMDNFKEARGERCDVIRPTDHDFVDGKEFYGTTEKQAAFRGEAGAERPAAIRPRPNLATNEGAMDGRSIYQDMYQAGTGARFEAKRPVDHYPEENGTFDGTTVNRETYIAAKGERFETKRPADTYPLREGQFDGLTTNRDAFQGDQKGERFDAKRPVDHYPEKDGIIDSKTVYSEAYQSGAKADRFEAKRPVDTYPLREGEMEKTTVNREAYKEGKGERYERTRPKDSFPKIDGPFDSITMNQQMFKGEALGRGDRLEAKRPTDHQMLDFNETIEKLTAYNHDFTGRQGERAEAKRPAASSHLAEGPFDPRTVSKEDFKGLQSERRGLVKQKDAYVRPDGRLEDQTIYKENFKGDNLNGSRSRPVKQASNLRTEGKMYLNTAYDNDFVGKQPEPCYAEKLIQATISKNVRPISKYNFSHEKRGHKFFKKLPSNPNVASANGPAEK